MKILVNAYKVRPNADVTLTTKPDDKIIAYGAKLFFRDKNGKIEERKKWTSSQLENGGATFEFDATGKERYEIDLGAEVDKISTLNTEMKFSQHPPKDDSDQLSLDPNEGGDIVRFWEFTPKG